MDIQHSLLPIYRKNPPKGYSIPLSELWSSPAHAALKKISNGMLVEPFSSERIERGVDIQVGGTVRPDRNHALPCPKLQGYAPHPVRIIDSHKTGRARVGWPTPQIVTVMIVARGAHWRLRSAGCDILNQRVARHPTLACTRAQAITHFHPRPCPAERGCKCNTSHTSRVCVKCQCRHSQSHLHRTEPFLRARCSCKKVCEAAGPRATPAD